MSQKFKFDSYSYTKLTLRVIPELKIEKQSFFVLDLNC